MINKPDILSEDDIGTIAKANLKISWLPREYLKPYLQTQRDKDWKEMLGQYWEFLLARSSAGMYGGKRVTIIHIDDEEFHTLQSQLEEA